MRALILLLLLFAPSISSGQAFDPLGVPAAPASGAAYDPYGRWEQPREVIDRDVKTTRLLSVTDGTPLYEAVPPPHSTPATESRMLPIIQGGVLPFEAGPKSPFLPGTNLRFEYHYLINFWRTYPEAKVRGAPPPGHVPPALSRDALRDTGGAPPQVVDVLFRQASALYAEVIAIPMIRRSQGVMIRPSLRIQRRSDEAGTQVYGFVLRIAAPELGGGGHSVALEICSNCVVNYGPAWGRYGRTQVVFLNPLAAFVVASDRPTHISEYRNGGGKQIPNPAFFDPARPKTDIQVLTVTPQAMDSRQARWAGQGAMAPDDPYARMVAASFIPDWRAAVDRLNGPAAPRAQ